MNRKYSSLPNSKLKFRILRHFGRTMAPNKGKNHQAFGTQNFAFEEDDGVISCKDKSKLVPEVKIPKCQKSFKGKGGNVGILNNAVELLVSAADDLRSCADCINRQFDTTHEKTTLVSQSRIFKITRLTEALLLIKEVIERLMESLSVLGPAKPEKIFTPVLINMLTKESTQVERISKNMSADKAESRRLDHDLREIRTVILRLIEAFEPVRQAVFRPDRRGDPDNDRVGNKTREYLRTLDIYWQGLRQAKETLPNEPNLPYVYDVASLENDRNSRNFGYEPFEPRPRRYWPV
ncbi:uncharacterized protein LOC129278457 [Lytechinus pictus]|uniref:uncharacterized protein LOC129278457 n=1 Tax=Lytechinus pictus TaxID=7653 RepID=UPI0030BA002E